MKLKVTYTNFNVKVPRLVAKVYKVTPFGLPDGILASIFTAKGQLISSSASEQAAVIPAASADGDTLIADSSQTSGWRTGKPSVSIESTINHLVNGGFLFAQRQTPDTDTTITDEKYGPDRWRTTRENADLQYSRQDASSESGLTSRYYGKFTKITNAGKFAIYQPLEFSDSIPLRGQDVIFQLKMKASSAKTIKIAIIELQAAGTEDSLPAALVTSWNVDSTDPTLGSNLAVVDSVQSCSVTTSWQVFSVTGTIPSNSKNIIVAIWSDADFTAADYLQVAEAGLYKGSTQRVWEPRPEATELTLCQRYYEKTFGVDTGPADGAGSNFKSVMTAFTASAAIAPEVIYKVSKRATPTITYYKSTVGTTANRWAYYDGVSAWASLDSQANTFSNAYGFVPEMTKTGALTSTQSYQVLGGWTADAEL